MNAWAVLDSKEYDSHGLILPRQKIAVVKLSKDIENPDYDVIYEFTAAGITCFIWNNNYYLRYHYDPKTWSALLKSSNCSEYTNLHNIRNTISSGGLWFILYKTTDNGLY